MLRSSPSIGALAAALARAQTEIQNPEKLLTATIRARDPREGDRTFRYAPLASGLDIVRKALGRHEIATVQLTGIDKDAGLIRLTTVLAHSSGEWLSSDWPVCGVGETASPKRMGAALTYARRYALFTLVGIAGEDDLDAPDLRLAPTRAPESEAAIAAETAPDGESPPDEGARLELVAREGPPSGNGAGRRWRLAPAPRPILAPDQSAQARDRLLHELGAIHSAEDAAEWAQKTMPAKNRLQTPDALALEAAFQEKLASFEREAEAEFDADDQAEANGREPPTERDPPDDRRSPAVAGGAGEAAARSEPPRRQVAPKTIRLRDKDHRKFVAQQPCAVCGRSPAEAHHLRFMQPRALGRKVSDEFIVPVCRLHHRELHRHGDEQAWWRGLTIDPVAIALALWRKTPSRPDPSANGAGRCEDGSDRLAP